MKISDSMGLRSFWLTAAAVGLAVACVMDTKAQTGSAVPIVVDLGGVLNGDTDDTLAFTPDGDTVFFDRSIGATKSVMISRRVKGRWTAPKVASFSGR